MNLRWKSGFFQGKFAMRADFQGPLSSITYFSHSLVKISKFSHFQVPFDDKRLVFPPFPAVILACILYAPFSSLNHSFLILTGGLIGYLAYDLTHYFIHYGSPSETSYFYKLKRTHNHHHFTAHDKGEFLN